MYFVKQDVFVNLFGTNLFYRIDRLLDWRNGTGMQLENSLAAIGSSGIFGHGFNKTPIYFPESGTDFIFAVAGEELGFVGTVVIIILLFLIVIECLLIARKAKDLGGRLICCGMATLVGFQSFVNIGVATGLMPNTGIPLPFVSYGLTSLVSLYIGMGFVLNVGLQPKKY